MNQELWLAPSTNTLALFVAWGKAISDFLTACGIPKTADTGQINWATVTVPGTTATSAGYEIRYLNDSLNATAPIYIKIEYGVGSAANYPGMWITTGTGSDGAGNLTGYGLTRTQLYLHQNWSNTIYPFDMSGDASGYSHLSFNTGPTGLKYPLLFERTRDAAGNITDQGIIVLIPSGSSNTMYYCSRTAAVVTCGYGSGGLLPRSVSSLAAPVTFGTTIPVAPIIGFNPTSGPTYTLRFLTVPQMTDGTTFSVARFGTQHRYRVMGQTAGYGFGLRKYSSAGEDAYACLAMLWE